MTTPPADVNYTFTPAQIDQLRDYGTVVRYPAGAPLIDEGDAAVDLIVTISGHTDVTVQTPDGPRRVGFMEAGQFTGDVGVLAGQISLASVTMGADGEVLRIGHHDLLRLLSDHSGFSEILVRTLTARRAFSRDRDWGTIVVIGAAYDTDAFAMRDLLVRHGAPHRWLDPETDPLASQLMTAKGLTATDLPALIFGRSRVLIRPVLADVVTAFGFDRLPDDSQADVLVVGAGPAGLAASVYAGSEGLSVVTLDGASPGGQAGTSSKIENYLGFPTGVSGRDLADRAAIQAQKFGVRLTSPAAADKLEAEDGGYRLHLKDGRSIRSHAVVIASGARYRRPEIGGLADYEGRGVYYGASPMEAQLCGGADVAVVGAGNSAGQGAMFLAQHARHVHVLFRRGDIRETMSDYLVRRLEEAPNVTLHPGTQIAGLHGNGAARDRLRLSALTVTTAQGEARLTTPFVFLFIGADPCSDWLPEGVRTDEKGFVKTGPQLTHLDLGRAQWPLERTPTQYETSWPRVYAVGDIRSGSVKRVASAVGEGSVVVSDIHRAIGEG